MKEYRSELICDLAETYHILNYRELPPSLTATLVTGLRADSRLKMKLTGTKVPTNTTIMSMIYDACSLLVWMNSEDGRKNRNRPKSLVKALTEEPNTKTMSFSSGDAFLKARQAALEKIRKGGNHA